jgi:sRNA-binding regulator protein Hfq
MSDPSAIPVRRVFDVRQDKTDKAGPVDASALPTVSPAGPRKLIRPQLPGDGSTTRYVGGRVSTPSPSRWNFASAPGANSHAEAFYLQKQIHSQTPMTFVLEDGEQIEGVIEWYDLQSIKVKRGNVRTLIYKASIKYLYKSTDTVGPNARL